MKTTLFLTTTLAGVLASSVVLAADGVGGVVAKPATIDYANAKPMVLPAAPVAPEGLAAVLAAPSAPKGTPGSMPGHIGNGKLSPITVPFKAMPTPDLRAPAQYGTRGHPYTTSRADSQGISTSRYYPYRAAGKLFFKKGTGSYICSGSLIKRGLVVTAAHCVMSFGTGTNGFYSGWQYIPSYANGVAPYGKWTARNVWVMNSYIDGTDSCASRGVVCLNDIAVIEVNAQNGAYPGTATGWFGVSYDGDGFTGTGIANGNQTQITQLGYPAGLDNGGLMERTDSLGYTSSSSSYNTIIGSQMGGGSSGGPWLINFGMRPTVTAADSILGYETNTNRVVGTSSWSYVGSSVGVRQMGASPFRAANIVQLINTACQYAASSAVCN